MNENRPALWWLRCSVMTLVSCDVKFYVDIRGGSLERQTQWGYGKRRFYVLSDATSSEP